MAKTKVPSFGDRLRSLRAAAGLTQAALAERAGLRTHSVWQIESGRRQVSWDVAERLAQALGVKVQEFSGHS